MWIVWIIKYARIAGTCVFQILAECGLYSVLQTVYENFPCRFIGKLFLQKIPELFPGFKRIGFHVAILMSDQIRVRVPVC